VGSAADHDGKRDFAGAALVIFVYALWLHPTHEAFSFSRE
jgi:hypothetical protein